MYPPHPSTIVRKTFLYTVNYSTITDSIQARSQDLLLGDAITISFLEDGLLSETKQVDNRMVNLRGIFLMPIKRYLTQHAL